MDIGSAAAWVPNPFLHYEDSRIYDPLTDRSLDASHPLHARMLHFMEKGDADELLARGGWIVPAGEDLSTKYRLKIVSLETASPCNQKCYFCPVSIAPREDEVMSQELFERIVSQLEHYRDTIDGVFLQSYNEPTVERRFVDHCRRLFQAGLPIAVLSNGSGLTPAKIDALMAAGTLRYLCINLSTLDRERYKQERGADHLEVVLRTLDHARDRPVARQMRIVVLGQMDDVHQRDFEAVRDRFAGSRFEVEKYHATDRAGWLEVGMKAERKARLAGCELIGSRPIQHIHITPGGKCILCCQDYDANYVLGDLSKQTVHEVMSGPEMSKMRRWTYGVEDAPDDFICRTCVFALTR